MKNQRSDLSHPVKQAREARGMSQLELAGCAKLTRQSIGAIESGRAKPSVDVALRLAKILERSVEELFDHTATADTIVAEPARPFVPGRLALAHIAGRWVAHGLRRDGLRVAADAISTGTGSQAELLRAASEARDNTLIAGCAAGLGLLTDRSSSQRGAGRYIALPCSSTVALQALAKKQVHVAGVHLVDAKSGNANIADVQRIVRKTALVLVTLARWEMGLVIAPGRAGRVRGPADLVRRGVRVAIREEGSGARRLLDQQLRARGIPSAASLPGALVTTGHLEVAHAVAIGAAETGIATRDAAISFGLGFVAISEERYDLAMHAEDEADPRIQRLLNALSTRGLRQELSSLGYDVSSAGERVAQLSAA